MNSVLGSPNVLLVYIGTYLKWSFDVNNKIIGLVDHQLGNHSLGLLHRQQVFL